MILLQSQIYDKTKKNFFSFVVPREKKSSLRRDGGKTETKKGNKNRNINEIKKDQI